MVNARDFGARREQAGPSAKTARKNFMLIGNQKPDRRFQISSAFAKVLSNS
jgi:hypothetical protein